MLNIKILYSKLDNIYLLLKKRNFILNYNIIYINNIKKKYINLLLESLNNKINIISKYISYNKNNNNFYYIKEVREIKKIILNYNKFYKLINNNIMNYLYKIPNIPDYIYKKNNINYIKYYKKKINKKNIKSYIDIGISNNYLENNLSKKISGSKFLIMKGKFCKLHRALINFMLNTHIKNNYKEIYLPLIVKENMLFNTGQLPKFKKNIFYIKNKIHKNDKHCLIPTSEVPLVNILQNKTLNEEDLPVKYVSYTPCFRFESKSYGSINNKLIRLYQFDKVEIVQFVNPKNSNNSLIEITNDSEKILKLLNLHYRRRLLFPHEMSFSSSKTYDLEVWFPYEKKYIEVSSCSNTTDFQSRRILSKFLYKKKNKKKYLHILNASGLAINRVLFAIVENYQNNIDFDIPEVLLPYF